MTVRVSQAQVSQNPVSRTARVSGEWQVDEKNRLAFFVDRKNARPERLTFSGRWAVNGSQELTYKLARTPLKTKIRREHALSFGGHWDISPKNRLVYSLSGESGGTLDLRGAFQSPSIAAKSGEIRYQLGAGAEHRRKGQALVLFGKWKLSRTLGVEFEMKRRTLSFGAVFSVGRDKISASLLRSGESAGLAVVFERPLQRVDGGLFIELKKDDKEAAIEGGARVRW